MPVQIINGDGKKVFEVRIRGKLLEEDCEQFVIEIEKLVRKDVNLQLLIDMTELCDVDSGCLGSENRFSGSHFSKIERLAMIGDTQWQKFMTAFSKPFTRATVRYFVHEEKEKARIWLGIGEARRVLFDSNSFSHD